MRLAMRLSSVLLTLCTTAAVEAVISPKVFIIDYVRMLWSPSVSVR